MDKQEIAANLVRDYQAVQNPDTALPMLLSYAISCVLVNKFYSQEELERGVMVDGYRISINYALAGDPLKIERVQ